MGGWWQAAGREACGWGGRGVWWAGWRRGRSAAAGRGGAGRAAGALAGQAGMSEGWATAVCMQACGEVAGEGSKGNLEVNQQEGWSRKLKRGGGDQTREQQ